MLASDIEGVVAIETMFATGVDKQARSVAAVVTRLVAEEKVPPHDIAVLICDGAGRSPYEKALAALPIPATAKLGRIEDYGNGSLTIDTARRSKDLERLAVILWGFGERGPERDRDTIYVGMSRATSAVYLVGSRETCERLMGMPITRGEAA